MVTYAAAGTSCCASAKGVAGGGWLPAELHAAAISRMRSHGPRLVQKQARHGILSIGADSLCCHF
jgi:hypothetical protein